MQLSASLAALLSGGSIIDLDGTVFVQLGLFAVAFVVLHALVFKPMLALLEAREQAIDGAREDVKRLDAEVKSKQTEFEAELRKVRSASGDERDRLRAEGAALERTLLENVRKETAETVAKSKASLQIEAQIARQRLATVGPELAREIASRILGREVQG